MSDCDYISVPKFQPYLPVPPDEVAVLPCGNARIEILPEDRVLTVPWVDRTIRLAREDRRIEVPADDTR